VQPRLPARAPVEPEQIKGARIVTPASGATKWGWLIDGGEQLVGAGDRRELAGGDGTDTPEHPRHTQRQPIYRGVQVGGAIPGRFRCDRAIRAEAVAAACER